MTVPSPFAHRYIFPLALLAPLALVAACGTPVEESGNSVEDTSVPDLADEEPTPNPDPVVDDEPKDEGEDETDPGEDEGEADPGDGGGEYDPEPLPPFEADPNDEAGHPESPEPVSLPFELGHDLTPAQDIDCFGFSTSEEKVISAETTDGAGGCPGDTVLKLLDGLGELITSNDDGGIDFEGTGKCSLLNTLQPAGDYILCVHDFSDNDEILGVKTTVTLENAPVCGDGIVVAGLETCDEGGAADGVGCSDSCTSVESGFDCSVAGQPCVPLCGNGLVDGYSEQCDDGNNDDGDGCASDCSAVDEGYSCPIAGAPCGQASPVNGGATCGDAAEVTAPSMGGAVLFETDLTGATGDNEGTCGGAEDRVDAVFRFTAPADAVATVASVGGDTLMYAYGEQCGVSDMEFACDDDGGFGTGSLLEFNVTAGSTYFIVLDTFSASGLSSPAVWGLHLTAP
jgi:cysteine-rich repeat protein